MATVIKLVRDKIPADGAISGSLLTKALVNKIHEEATEVAEIVTLNSSMEKLCEELADVIEACLWLGLRYGITPEQIERERMKKLQEKGGFDKGMMKAVV